MAEAPRALREYRYEKLTWPDVNDAVASNQVCILPCGSVEQHGPHLPLDVDIVCPAGIAAGCGRRMPERVLVLPVLAYGFTAHVMDFPGTINTNYDHFIDQILDVTRSLAYHGFKKIILLNGHGSNTPCLDLAARRTNLETDAECCAISWWTLLTVDRTFLPQWRESRFPGGCAHACELETSVYMHLDHEQVRTEEIRNGAIAFNEGAPEFAWLDLFAAGPAGWVPWTSAYCAEGVMGDAELATPEKGRAAYEEAVRQLGRLVDWFGRRPPDRRRSLHREPPTIPMPWGNRSHAAPHRGPAADA
jgi:creatinine amidohydrolase